MAVLAAVGNLNVTTATAGNTVAVSGLVDGDTGAALGTPTCVLFWWTGGTAGASVERASMNRGFGCAISTSARWAVGSFSADASGASATACGHDHAACILEMADGASAGAMDLQSMDSGGFTLVIDTQFTTDLRVSFLALGGDVTASQGIFTATGTAPTTQVVAHGLGSTPAAVLLASASISSAPPGIVADSRFTLGAFTATGQGVLAGDANDGSNTMVTRGYALGSECLLGWNTGPTGVISQASFNAVDATNFTVNWIARITAFRTFWVALGGTDVEALVGSLTTQTDTTTAMTEPLGFRPKAILFASAARAESSAGTVTDHDQVSIGCATSTAVRVTQAALDETGVGTSEVSVANGLFQVYTNIDTSGAIQGTMDLQTVTDTGFTTIMDDADPSGAFVWYLAIGNAVAGGFVPFPRPRGMSGGMQELSGGMAA